MDSLRLAALFTLVRLSTGCADSGSAPPDAAAPAAADLPVCPIPCLRDLGAACQPAGECSGESDRSGVRVCFANGVRAAFSAPQDNATEPMTSMAAITVNGSSCWSVESTASARGSVAIYRDGSGAELARTTIVSFPGATITCAGTSHTVDRRICAPTPAVYGSLADPRCKAGSCP